MTSNKKILVAPSLLAANPLRLEEDLLSAESLGIDFHHVDVMDGHFVPNLTYGPPLVKAMKSICKCPLDVHIMVSNPDEVASQYVDAGADFLVFHVEAARHAHRLIHSIQSKGVKPGVAINPGTSLSMLEPLLHDVSIVNVMSVNPGFGGQSFIPQTFERIRKIRKMLEQIGRDREVLIEVDGGVNAETCADVVAAGADLLVAGTFFYGAKDRAAALKVLKGL